jgi:hypothetical protein
MMFFFARETQQLIMITGPNVSGNRHLSNRLDCSLTQMGSLVPVVTALEWELSIKYLPESLYFLMGRI